MINRRFDEAIKQYEATRELFPDHGTTKGILAWCYGFIGRHEDSVAICKETGSGAGWGAGKAWIQTLSFANSTMRSEVVAILDSAKEDYAREPTGRRAWLVAYYLTALGEKKVALKWLGKSAVAFQEDLTEGRDKADTQVFDQAQLYAWAGFKEQAFEWLDLAVKYRSPQLSYLHRSFPFDGLRDDPRFNALLRQRGYPEEVINNY